jgi:hypothetical protein
VCVEKKSKRRARVVGLPSTCTSADTNLLLSKYLGFVYGGEFLSKLNFCYHSFAGSLSVLELLFLT